MRKTSILFLALSLLLAGAPANAAPKTKVKTVETAPAVTPSGVPEAVQVGEDALNPENLGAQAFLEDLMVRRYSQELSTFVDRGAFTLGAQLDFAELGKEADPSDNETPADLMLGTLNTDELLKKYGSSDGVSGFQGFLGSHTIKTVAISVGLKDDLNPTVKAEVEKWLTTRLSSEFGKAGKGTVTEIKMPKGIWAWISRFQGFAGQLVLGFAILFGALLWGLMSPKNAESKDAPSQAVAQPFESRAPEKEAPKDVEQKTIEKDQGAIELAAKDIRQLTQQLLSLMPKISQECETLLRTWCQGGDEGRLKLACFVEAVGTEVGKLPIPVDALQDLSKVFSKMPGLDITEKRDSLRKAYWDALMAINLGSDSLAQPFGYLGGLNIGLVNQVLIDQNPKMKALVTLHMSPALRESYMKGQTTDAKRELLTLTSQMSEIAVEELRSFDGLFRSKLQPQTGGGFVALDSSLLKLITALTPIEEATLLSDMTGPAFDEYKRSTPSLAFLGQWPDDKLSSCLSRAMPDEVVAFSRVRPDLKDRMIALSPPMLAEVAADELQRPDTMNDKDKNALLITLKDRLKEMVTQKEVDLEEVFKAKDVVEEAIPDNVHEIAPQQTAEEAPPAAAATDDDESKKAA